MKSAGPGCCGPVGTQVNILKQASSALMQGHRGVAALYRSIARQLADAEERDALEREASRHDVMASECEVVTIPDLVEEP